ncbi:hypothetical protein ACR42D_03770 [Desulfovibrio caledoniensis]
MKKIILTAVVTLLMLSPAWAADVRFPPDPLLVASKQDDRNRNGRREDRGTNKPGTVVIKGKGGKVTGVEREPDRRPPRKK